MKKFIVLSVPFVLMLLSCKSDKIASLNPEEFNISREIATALVNDENLEIHDFHKENDLSKMIVETPDERLRFSVKALSDDLYAGFITPGHDLFEWTSSDRLIRSELKKDLNFYLYDKKNGKLQRINLFQKAKKYALQKSGGNQVEQIEIGDIKWGNYPENKVFYVEVDYKFDGHDTNYILMVDVNQKKVAGVSCDGAKCCHVRYYPGEGYFECSCSNCVMNVD